MGGYGCCASGTVRWDFHDLLAMLGGAMKRITNIFPIGAGTILVGAVVAERCSVVGTAIALVGAAMIVVGIIMVIRNST